MQNIPYSHKIMSTQNMHTFENHNIQITNQKKQTKTYLLSVWTAYRFNRPSIQIP